MLAKRDNDVGNKIKLDTLECETMAREAETTARAEKAAPCVNNRSALTHTLAGLSLSSAAEITKTYTERLSMCMCFVLLQMSSAPRSHHTELVDDFPPTLLLVLPFVSRS